MGSIPHSRRLPPFFTELKRQSTSLKVVLSARTDPSEPDNQLWKRLESAPESKRKNLIQSHIRLQALKVLSLPADFPLEQRQPLQELGFDSLMAVELRNLLRKGLPFRELPATLVFDYPTLESLTDYLSDQLFIRNEGKETIAIPLEKTEMISVSDISEEEAQALLFAELNDLQERKNRK